MHLLAPAKINLHLRVGRRRDDGFHPLLSWMCTVGLFDSLTLEVAPPAVLQQQIGGDTGRPLDALLTGTGAAAGIGATDLAAALGDDVELIIRGDDDQPDLPCDERNLIVRIATAFVDAVRRERSHERIPADPRSEGPAFHEEGYAELGFPAADRAIAATGSGSVASAGAAPHDAPGTEGERPWVSKDDRGSNRPVVTGPTGLGAGAVRGAERSGGSSRHVGVRITLHKRVPIGAGLGGGSSDAAFTLVALDRLLATEWTVDRLCDFAADFGSDVPFFVAAALGSTSAACRGRGDVVRPVTRPAARWAVLFSPPFGLPTPAVYARFDAMELGSDRALADAAEPDWSAWARLPARELLARLVNDLEPAAFSLSPKLAEMRAMLEQGAGRVVRMSGSGSSLFTLFDADEHEAAREAARVGSNAGVASIVAEIAPQSTLE